MKLEDAWLNIGDVDEDSLFDPVGFIFRQGTTDDFLLKLAWLMMRPEYFSMVCKQVFNIDLLPVFFIFVIKSTKLSIVAIASKLTSIITSPINNFESSS